MDVPVFENLDLACAKAGKEIAEKPTKELEKIITDALGVLEEQGVYALFLFLEAHSKKEISKGIKENLIKLLKQTPRQNKLLKEADTDIPIALQKISENLDTLLLARNLLRQSLVYARYHAKLREESEVVT